MRGSIRAGYRVGGRRPDRGPFTATNLERQLAGARRPRAALTASSMPVGSNTELEPLPISSARGPPRAIVGGRDNELRAATTWSAAGTSEASVTPRTAMGARVVSAAMIQLASGTSAPEVDDVEAATPGGDGEHERADLVMATGRQPDDHVWMRHARPTAS